MLRRSPVPPRGSRHYGRKIVLSIAAFLVLVGITVYVLITSGWPTHYVSHKGSGELGRSFTIEGPLKIEWNWHEPTVDLHRIKLANMPGAPEPEMVTIDDLHFRIKIWKLLEGQLNLPEIDIDHPQIVLEKFDADTKNWDFPALSKANVAARAALPTKRSNFPIIGKLTIKNGRLTYRDKTTGLDTTLDISTANGSSEDFLRLSGTGELQGQAFAVNAEGGSLDMLRDSGKDYPLNLHIQMGKTDVKVDGTFHDPVKMEGIDTKLDLSGDNLADLFYLTGIPLPPSPPYALSGRLKEQNDVWSFEDFKGRMGQSDLSGNLTYDTSGKRNYMKAALVSQELRMEDLAGLIGAKKGNENTVPKGRVLPDMPLDLGRLRAADLDVDFKGVHINQPGWPIDNMHAFFHLKDGVLRIDPLSFGVADGKISGTLVLDGSHDEPTLQTDLLLQSLSLKPFFGGTSFASLSQGRFGGRFEVNGHGKSLAAVLGDGNGHITLMMSGGTISKLIVDAAGLDITKATPELLDHDKETGIRCAIGDFGMQGGMLNSDIFVFDTTASNIQGEAHINLKNETIDASIRGYPKDVTVSGQIPITVSGSLAHPDIGLSARVAAERGGAAAALSAFLTPLAAVIPFIDVDLGKNADCGDLINAASRKSGVAPQSVTSPAP